MSRLGLVTLLLLCTVAFADTPPPATIEQAGAARVARQTVAAFLAPVPLDAPLFLGTPGLDATRYPTQHINRALLRALLSAHRYADLNASFEMLQKRFETDPRYEYWPHEAGLAFSTPERDLLPQLDAWVAATPSHFAPYYARGMHRAASAYARRGSRVSSETHDTDFAAMELAVRQAKVDLDRALELRPKLVGAAREEIDLVKLAGDHAVVAKTAERAFALCPTCLLARVTYMHALLPRWGGSYDAMMDVARRAPVAKNPRLKVLPAIVDEDKAEVLSREGHDDAGALVIADHGCTLGDLPSLLELRARLREQTKDYAGARRDIDRAIALFPGWPDLLFERVRIASWQKDYEQAGRDLLEALRIEPTDEKGKASLAYVVNGLVFRSGELYRAGKVDEALRVVELATDLDPRNRKAGGAHAYYLEQPMAGHEGEVDVLRAKLKDTPTDLRAHQHVDYLLSKTGRFPEILQMWDVYLARTPNDGRAQLERAGTLWQLGRRDESVAGARRACELGVSQGCMRANMP